jgi:hypothetical protein
MLNCFLSPREEAIGLIVVLIKVQGNTYTVKDYSIYIRGNFEP